MFQKIVFVLVVISFVSCTKKQLKDTTLTISDPIEQQIYHKGDTVFINGQISYKNDVNKIGFFVALADTLGGDSTFYTRTILPLKNPHKIQEYYISDFTKTTDILMSYGKRNIKTGQIYEVKEINLKFVP